VAKEFNGSFAMKEFKQHGVYGTYKRHFLSFVDKVDEFAAMEEENQELNQKLAHLERDKIVSDAKSAERDLASLNETLEENLKNEAGSELGTALNTIQYEVPKHLASPQLMTLAMGYFKKEDFEKSAILFHHLLGLKDDPQFRKPETYLMSAISWHRLHNYHLAMRDLREVMDHSVKADPVHRTAVLWKAMTEKAMGKRAAAEQTMLHYLEWYPHSEEASFLNGLRKPASHEKAHPSSHEAQTESHEESHHVEKQEGHPVEKGHHEHS